MMVAAEYRIKNANSNESRKRYGTEPYPALSNQKDLVGQ